MLVAILLLRRLSCQCGSLPWRYPQALRSGLRDPEEASGMRHLCAGYAGTGENGKRSRESININIIYDNQASPSGGGGPRKRWKGFQGTDYLEAPFVTFSRCHLPHRGRLFYYFHSDFAAKNTCYLFVENFLKKMWGIHRIIAVIYDKKIDICGGVIVL